MYIFFRLMVLLCSASHSSEHVSFSGGHTFLHSTQCLCCTMLLTRATLPYLSLVGKGRQVLGLPVLHRYDLCALELLAKYGRLEVR